MTTPENRFSPNLLLKVVVGIFILFIVIAFFPIVIIGAGERGVVFNQASGIEDRVLGEGTHFRVPVLESVSKLSIKVQKTEVKAEAASKDLQTVNTDIVVNWHLDSGKVNKIYQTIGDQQAVTDRILVPAVSEVVKAATAQKTASEVLAKRPELKGDIDKSLSDRLGQYNILLDDVSIVNVTFSPEFNAAIEQKQIAQQNAEKALFTADQASAEAQATINKARGDAEAQRLQQASLTTDLLQLRAIEKWNGVLPQVTGQGSLPFINIPIK